MLVLGLVQGLVVAGRFWCSYAWASLTLTTRARPRAPVFCTRARVRARYRARACRRASSSARGRVPASSRRACVLLGGVAVVCGGVALGVPVWRPVVCRWCVGGVAPYLFFLSTFLYRRRWWCAVVVAAYLFFIGVLCRCAVLLHASFL